MANKKNKKKVAESKKAPVKASNSGVESKKAAAKKQSSKAKAKKDAKPGFFARIKKYFSSVRSEMKRVTWPSKKELINLSLVVCASLIVVGLVIAALDALVGQVLFFISGFRG